MEEENRTPSRRGGEREGAPNGPGPGGVDRCRSTERISPFAVFSHHGWQADPVVFELHHMDARHEQTRVTGFSERSNTAPAPCPRGRATRPVTWHKGTTGSSWARSSVIHGDARRATGAVCWPPG